MRRMLDHVIDTTNEYIERMPKARRKTYGQFFTSRETALFMASLFNIPAGKTEVSILDPGAGSGILAAAMIERLQLVPKLQKIHLTCYETDANIMDLLKENLEWVCNQSPIRVEFQIVSDNFILSQTLEYNHMLGAAPAPLKFDMVIGNPPYMKNVWNEKLTIFLSSHETLISLYASKRVAKKMPVKINGADFTFSPGKHNQLQKAIVAGILDYVTRQDAGCRPLLMYAQK